MALVSQERSMYAVPNPYVTMRELSIYAGGCSHATLATGRASAILVDTLLRAQVKATIPSYLLHFGKLKVKLLSSKTFNVYLC